MRTHLLALVLVLAGCSSDADSNVTPPTHDGGTQDAISVDDGSTTDGASHDATTGDASTDASTDAATEDGGHPFGEFDLMTPSGSLRFPPENNLFAEDPEHALALVQPATPWPTMFAPGTSEAFFLTARLPIDKRRPMSNTVATTMVYALFGGLEEGSSAFRALMHNRSDGTKAKRNVIDVRSGSATLSTSPIDEDAFLIVLRSDATSIWAEWYSLADGSVHAGAQSAMNNTHRFSPSSPQSPVVGGFHPSPTMPNTGNSKEWPGEIELVGYYRGASTQQDWQAIALGADPRVQLPHADTDMAYFRRLDGTATTLAPPSGVADTSEALVPWNGSIEPGSQLRRQTDSDYLLIDEVGGGEGHVFGLRSDDGWTSRQIPISGTAAGHTGQVEVAVVHAQSGQLVADWTDMGPIADSVWSGTVTVPKTDGWVFAVARATDRPSEVVQARDRFGVGWKVLQLGQSQTAIYLGSERPTSLALQPSHLHSATYVTTDNQVDEPALFQYIGGHPAQGGAPSFHVGLAGFVNQLRVFDASTPIMVIDAAVPGSSPEQLCVDTVPGRSWSILQDKLDDYGNDISVVAMNWITSGWGASATTMEALVFGTGAGYDGWLSTAGGDASQVHSLAQGLLPGFAFGLSPGTRASSAQHHAARIAQVKYANQEPRGPIVVGPPVGDFFIDGGPHQPGGADPNGFEANTTFGSRQAVLVARAVGLDSSQNSCFDKASLSSDGTTITVTAVLPNGGSLYSPAPTNLRNFLVADANAVDPAKGFSARIAGNTVVLTKNSGTWTPGTRVRYLANGENNLSDDHELERALMDGMVYETWSPDILGKGLPVTGMLADGAWVPEFDVVTE